MKPDRALADFAIYLAAQLADETESEIVVGTAFRNAIKDLFDRCGAPYTALGALRADALFREYRAVAHLDKRVTAMEVAIEDIKNLVILMDAAGKARERLRKAMTELEESLEIYCGPKNAGLADTLRPILKAADGVLDEAIAEKAGPDAPGPSPRSEAPTLPQPRPDAPDPG